MSEATSQVLVEGTRSDVWYALSTVKGVTSWLAPGAEIHPVEGGFYRLAFDSKGANAVDGGDILTWARDQELVVQFAPPKGAKGLQAARLHLVVEPVARLLTRVIVTQEPMGDGPEWERVRGHLEEAWAIALDRLRRRMTLNAPTIGGYDPFWSGL